MALVGFSASAVWAMAYQNGDYIGSLNKKASGAQCFIMALGLFWDIATGLPWTPNGVGSPEPKEYCIFLPAAHYLTINSQDSADSSLNKLLLLDGCSPMYIMMRTVSGRMTLLSTPSTEKKCLFEKPYHYTINAQCEPSQFVSSREYSGRDECRRKLLSLKLPAESPDKIPQADASGKCSSILLPLLLPLPSLQIKLGGPPEWTAQGLTISILIVWNQTYLPRSDSISGLYEGSPIDPTQFEASVRISVRLLSRAQKAAVGIQRKRGKHIRTGGISPGSRPMSPAIEHTTPANLQC